MAVPQSKPFRSEEIFFASDRDSSPESFPSRSGNLDAGTFGQLLCPQPRSPRISQLDRSDELSFLSSLKALIAAGGDHGLEPILETITDAAQLLTNASGAALAMWKDGAMVCRARNGETAPPLGAHLNAETGISGECLRTGKMQHCTDAEEDPRVDVEACRSRGLRSIAVLPIQAAGETNGILVVFSTHSAAFTECDIAFLQQLASLAERARAAEPQGASAAAPKFPPGELVPAQPVLANLASDIDEPLAFLQQLASLAERARAAEPQGASAAAPKFPSGELVPAQPVLANLASDIDELQPSSVLSASDRIRDVALASLGNCRRALVSGCVSAYASIRYSGQWVRRAVSTTSFGDVALASLGKRSRPFILGAIGAVVVALLALAIWLGWRGPPEASHKTKVPQPVASTVMPARAPDKDPVSRPNAGGESLFPSKTSAGIPVKLASKLDVIPQPNTQPDAPMPATDAAAKAALPHGTATEPAVETLTVEPPPVPVCVSNTASLQGVLAAPLAVPELSSLAVSQGVSGGRLVRRVSPTYPAQALMLRLQGRVILDATIFEDGTVHDLAVVQGHPMLAKSAQDAVRRWRYQPYELNGKPVRTKTTITVDFKLPYN